MIVSYPNGSELVLTLAVPVPSIATVPSTAEPYVNTIDPAGVVTELDTCAVKVTD